MILAESIRPDGALPQPMSSSSKQKQQRGYNPSPLHPVYPFSACFALFTVCFWLAVHTSLHFFIFFALSAGLGVAQTQKMEKVRTSETTLR